MESKQLQILLDKFFDGQTTLKEERMLKTYFLQDGVEEVFAPYKTYFTKMQSAQKVSLNKPIGLRKKRGVFAWIRPVVAVAAVASVLVWLSVPTFDTLTEEELAYAAFKENMVFVADQLNRAEQDIAYINHLYDKPKAYLKYE